MDPEAVEPQASPQPAPGPFRASDADRHATVTVLQDAVARGLLTHDEGGERMTRAFAARYVEELPPLTADLPRAQPPPPAAPGWRALADLALIQARTSLSEVLAGASGPRRALALAGGLVVALLLLVALGSVGLHLLGGGFHRFGPGPGFQARP